MFGLRKINKESIQRKYFSVIGNQHKSIKNVQYFKYMQTNMTYNKEENIVIHRGLFKALRII